VTEGDDHDADLLCQMSNGYRTAAMQIRHWRLRFRSTHVVSPG
jgi:hypothetical protein